MWIERSDGSCVYVIPGRVWVIAKVTPVKLGNNRQYSIHVLDRMMWSSIPGTDIEAAKEKAFQLVRDICGEILSAIPESK